MLALSPLSVPNTVGPISAALDLLGLDMNGSLACQLAGGADTDAVVLYASNLSSITSTSQAVLVGAIGILSPSGSYESGRTPVQIPPPRYRYLYVTRAPNSTVATTGVLFTAVGQETAGTSSPSSGAVAAQVIYRQGAPNNPMTGVHGDFAGAFAAWTAIPGATTIVDGSVAQPFVPSGTYNLPPAVLTMIALNYEHLFFHEGASFTTSVTNYGTNLYFVNIYLIGFATSTIPFSVTNNDFAFTLTQAYLFPDDSSTVPFIAVGAGALCVLVMEDSSGISGSAGGAPVITCATGSQGVQVNASDFATIGSASFGGAGQTKVFIEDPSVNFDLNQLATTPVDWRVGGGTIISQVTATNVNGQSIPDAGVRTVVTVWSANHSVAPLPGGLTLATGIFEAPVRGMYPTTVALEFTAHAAALGAEFTVAITVNGSIVSQGVYECPVAALSVKRQVQTSANLFLNAGDLVRIEATQASGSGAIALTTTGVRNTWTIAFAPS